MALCIDEKHFPGGTPKYTKKIYLAHKLAVNSKLELPLCFLELKSHCNYCHKLKLCEKNVSLHCN